MKGRGDILINGRREKLAFGTSVSFPNSDVDVNWALMFAYNSLIITSLTSNQMHMIHAITVGVRDLRERADDDADGGRDRVLLGTTLAAGLHVSLGEAVTRRRCYQVDGARHGSRNPDRLPCAQGHQRRLAEAGEHLDRAAGVTGAHLPR
jgi:hypothetical protein